MSLTQLSIKRPILIIVIFIVLSVLGIFSFYQLKYELIPDVAPPYVSVTVIYPGASPKEVENSVTKIIEESVSTVEKLKHVSSYSSEGVSSVVMEFTQDTNANAALQDVQRKVNEVVYQFPQDAKAPIVSKFSLSELPIIQMGVLSSLDSREMYKFVKDNVKPRFSKIKGVGQVFLAGGEEREIRVNLDMDKLNGYNISILAVLQSIKSSNADFPAGKIKDSDGQFIVRISGKYESLENLKKLIITRNSKNGLVKLEDIAEIEDGIKDINTICRIDGRTSLGIQIQKQSGANTVEVSKLVKDEIKSLEKDYKSIKIKFDISQDNSDFIMESAGEVGRDLLLAILLVGLVMLVFLHSIRNSLIIMIAIPTSLITTFIGMYVLNFTLNLMTLLALSLVIGILVDDSIVVLENIYRHLEMGKDKKKASLEGRNEIGFAALSITLVDVVVFLPLALIQGMIGNIVRQYSLVVVVSTLVSLFVSFTITPMLASRFSKIEQLAKTSFLGKFGVWFEVFFEKVVNFYLKVLKWALSRKKIVVTGVAVLFIGSVLLIFFGFIGSEFISPIDKGEISIQIELPERTMIEETNITAQKIEKILFDMKETKKVFLKVGASSDGFMDQSSANIAELQLTLVPKSERSKSVEQISREIKDKVRMISGIKVRVSPIGLFGSGDSFPIGFSLSGTNYDDVQKSADKIQSLMRQVKGTGEVKQTTSQGKPEMKVDIDKEKISELGLTLDSVGATLRIALTGDDSSKYREGESEYSIRILLDQFDRNKTSELGKIKFINNSGDQIELRQFANIYPGFGPNQLRRQDRQVSIMVLCQAVGRPTGDIGNDIKAKLKDIKLPEGVTVKEYGDTENQTDSFSSLGIALIIAILFVYLIMVALFNSFLYPFVVLFSIPVAIVGALLALALSMRALNIFSILGIIMLLGLVCKNAILIVDRAKANQESGMSVLDSLIEAGKTRLRPIVMTTTAMVIGMMPIALAFGAGAEIKAGLGTVLVGGLTSSMFLTVFIVPVVYMIFDKLKNKKSKSIDDIKIDIPKQL